MITQSNWIYYLLCAVAGYLLGHVQFAVIISRLKYKDDVRNHGSGNAGTTNMLRVFGLKSGLVTFIGDFLKGVAGVLIGRLIMGETGGYVMALFVILGHDFPVLLGFRGGKGVASSFGALWILHPWIGIIVTLSAAAALVIFKTISIVSMIGGTVYMVLALIFHGEVWLHNVVNILFWALIVVRHTDNIKRIIKGEEKKVSIGKRADKQA